MKNPVFTGAGVAIITPMYEDGSINFDELGRIIEDQIARSTDAIVICGTTGECSTMTDEEQLAAIKYTVDVVNHRVPVIAGAGSNDTDHGCALAAKWARGDALLMVTCATDLAGQSGGALHRHARGRRHPGDRVQCSLPHGPEHCPGNGTGAEQAPADQRHQGGFRQRISGGQDPLTLCGDELNIYSGNDDQVVPLLALGGKGVISVVSNVAPELVHNCCQAFFDGDTAKARDLQLEMLPLSDALFCSESIPVKYAMNLLG